MKKVKPILAALALAASFAACDAGFDAMNTSDIAINDIEPAFMLNHALYWTSPYYESTVAGVMNFEMAIVQQIVTPFGTSLRGGNYNQENPDMSNRHWNAFYGNVIKNTVDIIEKYSDDPERVNIVNMARILRAYAGMILTDSYGDVPYSQAGKGYHEGVLRPEYDTQESIYNAVLTELDAAVSALDPGGSVETAEVLYAGDIEKWKRFGWSLLFRAAMRVSEVDQALAQVYIDKAIAGGMLQSPADNALVRHGTEFRNTFGETLQARESANYYIPNTFINYLLDNNDPRIAIAIRHPGALNGGDQTEANRTRVPGEQIGFPMGYDNSSIVAKAAEDGVSSLYAYSQYDVTTIASIDVPFMMLTFSQNQLLLAEAVVRGWASGNASQLFESAIRAHFEDLTTHGHLVFDEGEVNAYVAAQVAAFNASDEMGQREHIGTQYWVTSFLNPSESWANFRRSGFPNLPPNPYPLSDIPAGEFIRRLIYPPGNDYNNNTANLQAAVDRQGPDEMDTRIWWDVELAWEP